jgi:hypothetical protein
MDYLKTTIDRLLIAINGFTTPQTVIDKLNKKTEQRQYRPQNYISHIKSIYINPPWQSKKKQ